MITLMQERLHFTFKDDSFENYNSFYYKWDSETNTLLVFTDGFAQFLGEERGSIIRLDAL
jgi:hypothetical protein